MSYGQISDTETITKDEMCERLDVSPKTLDRMMTKLGIVPFGVGSACPLISGRAWNRAIYREQIRCQGERQRQE